MQVFNGLAYDKAIMRQLQVDTRTRALHP